MSNIKLSSNGLPSFTCVPNIFIDKYMTNANGEYIKIYLYLLRFMEKEDQAFSIQHLADIFEYTEKDVLRALSYWEKQNLIGLEFDSADNLTNILLKNPCQADSCDLGNPQKNFKGDSVKEEAGSGETLNQKDAYTLEQVEQFQDDEAVQEILFITENYLGRTLNTTDIRTILYWYDGLKFSTELIEYLIETCTSNGHSSLRYMEKIALSWTEKGITTVSEARAAHAMHSQCVYGVMNAFGISGRNLIANETAFAEKWAKEYAFSMDIIKEACRRTISATGKASFEYADTILTNWHKNHVHNLEDVVKLDTARKGKTSGKTREASENAQSSRFHNFPQRTYNYDKLEQQLLNTTS